MVNIGRMRFPPAAMMCPASSGINGARLPMRFRIKVLTSARSSATRRWSDFSDRDAGFGSLLRGIMEPNFVPYLVFVTTAFLRIVVGQQMGQVRVMYLWCRKSNPHT